MSIPDLNQIAIEDVRCFANKHGAAAEWSSVDLVERISNDAPKVGELVVGVVLPKGWKTADERTQV